MLSSLGTYMSDLPNDTGKIALLTIHMILGSIILIVIIARFIAPLSPAQTSSCHSR